MAEIKYVQVPVRVKPHTDYLDTKGVEELWIKIKEYVAEHGGENGSVNEAEVNKLISDYYKAHKDELKGEPFTYADLTAAQKAELKGEKGDKGDKGDSFKFEDFTPEQLESLRGAKGDKGQDGTVSFDELTDEQKLSLKGEKGDKGDAFEYSDFTPEQLAGLKGEKGDKGADGTMVFEDLTEEQRASLKGDKGDKGDTGAAFTYDMFTQEQLEALKVKGDKGDKGDQGERGEQGIQGIQGIQGVQGLPGTVDYSLVYKKTEIDKKLAELDIDVDLSDINLDNYYDKTEVDAKFDAIEIEGSTGIHVGDDAPANPLVSVWVDTDGIPYDGDTDLHETFYTKEDVDDLIDKKKYNLSEMVNDVGFITEGNIPAKTSDLVNDSGFVTSENVYTKGSVYTKDEVNTALEAYVKSDNIPDRHTHGNIQLLNKLSTIDGALAFDGALVGSGSTGEGNIDLSGYALKDHTHEQYLTEHQDLSAYALKTDIPTIPEVDLTNYYNKEEIDALLANLGGGEVLPASEEGEF